MNIPKYTIPLLVILSLVGGFLLRSAFTQPSTSVNFDHQGEGATLECIVEGVKCKGTAYFFTTLFDGVPGIIGIETFATEHKAVFTYDPEVITPDEIRSIMEAPIPMRDGTARQVFKCLSMSSD